MQPDATLNERQARAAALEAAGHTTADISGSVGVHRATIFRWRKDQAYRTRVAVIAEDSQRVARASLESAASDAVACLRALLKVDDPRVALRAAVSILDRTGHGPAHRIDLTAERYPTSKAESDVEELQRVLAEMDIAAK